MLHEMGEYRYPDKKPEKEIETSTRRFELPMKKDDHTPEALGRFLAGRYHSVSQQYGGGAKISTARFFNSLGGRSTGDSGASAPSGVAVKRTGQRRGTWMQGR
jgi:hypothetical protein